MNTAVGGAVRSGVRAENVQLNGSNGITHDLDGNLVFCEQNVVRRLNPDGTIQTIAGTGVSGFSGDGDNVVFDRRREEHLESPVAWEKVRFTPGRSAASNGPRLPGFAPNICTYQALVSSTELV